MTGFARSEGQYEAFGWAWELKSVNSKSLDMRFRLPSGFDFLEPQLKATLGQALKRGSVSATLSVTETNRPAELRINETVLEQVIRIVRALETRIDAAPPRLDGLLAIRGVVELAELETTPEEQAARTEAITASFSSAAAALTAAREAEGARLSDILYARLEEIAALVEEAERAAAAQPNVLRDRFSRQVAELLDKLPPLPEDRLAQELALLIQRADVREELDRLRAHVAGARELIAEGTAVGRRLDFLCQEFNREANTLCSKSAELGLTRLGLSLKSAIEQLREQVQNVE